MKSGYSAQLKPGGRDLSMSGIGWKGLDKIGNEGDQWDLQSTLMLVCTCVPLGLGQVFAN